MKYVVLVIAISLGFIAGRYWPQSLAVQIIPAPILNGPFGKCRKSDAYVPAAGTVYYCNDKGEWSTSPYKALGVKDPTQ